MPKPEEKSVFVTTKISYSDREILKRQANRMGMKFSAYIAWLLVNAIPRNDRLNSAKEQSHV